MYRIKSYGIDELVNISFHLLVLFLILVVLPTSSIIAQAGSIPKGFVPIFNGKNLNGWHISRTNHHGTVGNFFVDNDIIVLKQHPYGQGGILLSDQKYRDFELYLEVKTAPGTNGGIFFRSNESGSAYQVELQGDGGLSTGNLLGEMLHVTTTSKTNGINKTWNKGGWNSFRLRVTGDAPHVTLWINGEKMWEVQAERNDLIANATEGMIALQLHWSETLTPVPGGSCCSYSWKPDAVHKYRNIAIKEL